VQINLYDQARNIIHISYCVEEGIRHEHESRAPWGFRKHVIESRQSLIINENYDEIWRKYDNPTIVGERPKSLAFIPLMAGDQVRGIISLQNMERENAFAESTVQLLTTLANSMSVALENARLFDETQRLFKAEQERVAELQIINSIQQGLAAELDFQAIVDLVGDKLSEVMNTGDLGIRWYDQKTNLIHFLYEFEHGNRLNLPPAPPAAGGVFERILKTRQLVVRNTRAEYTGGHIPGTDFSESIAAIPIISSDRVIGAIQLENYEREYAYGESELRLLTTIAASLGTALENARLFDETQQRNAELAIINAVQQALAAELDIQGIYDAVGEKLREIFDAQTVSIYSSNLKTRIMSVEYSFEKGQKYEPMSVPFNSLYDYVVGLNATFVKNGDFPQFAAQFKDYKVPQGEMPRSLMSVPVYRNKETDFWVGVSIQDMDGEKTFAESDVRLLETLANAMSVALQNARLFDETQRLLKVTEDRAAELAVINSIQNALASQLDFQSIVDVVGDKIESIFNSETIYVALLDEKTNLVHIPYYLEEGKRYVEEPFPLGEGFTGHVLTTKQPLVINENLIARGEELGAQLSGSGSIRKSWVGVPILVGDRAIGIINLQDAHHEHAFSDSDVNLLNTIASSMGVALENARLFDETQRLFKAEQERVAELQIINSIQQGLAAELDFQAIVDLVGDKLREVFNTPDLGINWHDEKANLTHYLYIYEHGIRINIPPRTPNKGGIFETQIKTRQPIIFNTIADYSKLSGASVPIPGTDQGKSYVSVPIISSDRVLGAIDLENFERENAFGESELRLLTTIAASLGTALENARLFDETQRLLKETEQRAAELAIINSVQQGLASKLDMQAIYDLVGNKIRDIFQVEVVYIAIRNPKDINQIDFPYYVDRGTLLKAPPLTLGEGLTSKVILDRQPLLVGTFDEQIKLGALLQDDERSNTYLGIPIIIGDFIAGVVSVQSYKEHTFNDSDMRLLTTLASSMGVALENARLFDETQRLLKITEDRAAELAIINSVQEGLASKLDMQAIYDLVGDKLSEVMNSLDIDIRLFAPETNQVLYPYMREMGKRLQIAPTIMRGMAKHVFETRQTLLINEKMAERMEELGSTLVPGTQMEKSYLAVPIVIADRALGMVSVSNYEKEKAFGDSEVRLLQTVVSAMSIALENARLFDETQRLLKETEQRAAELAIINSVQEGLASKLEMQAIYDLVGDKIQSMFNAQSVIISSFDHDKQISRLDYAFEDGGRVFDDELLPFSPMNNHLIATRQPVVINENSVEASKQYGLVNIEGTRVPKSLIYVPFGTGTQVNGYFSLQNMDRENAFAESDVRLLQTLAGSMGIALENARLFNAEQQRAAELAVISSIQEGMAAELDFETIVNLVGDKLREVFKTGEIGIRWFDIETQQID